MGRHDDNIDPKDEELEEEDVLAEEVAPVVGDPILEEFLRPRNESW